jgi:hypothetical protein
VITLLNAILYKESPKQKEGKRILHIVVKLSPQAFVDGKNYKTKNKIGIINPVINVIRKKKIYAPD